MAAPDPQEINDMIKKITKPVSNCELPREPKFYPNENLAIPYSQTAILRVPSGRSTSRYTANEDGIHKEWDELDQNGEVIHTIGRMVLPKEVFVSAYNAYIKGNEG